MPAFLSNFVMNSLASAGSEYEMLNYKSALGNALDYSPPPYSGHRFGEEFRRMARDPSWFGGLLVSDADLEGYSAKQLWIFASTITDQGFANGVMRHADDEARHSRVFAGFFTRIFPNSASEQVRERLAKMSPNLKQTPSVPTESAVSNTSETRTFEEILSTAILINLYEVKALILGHLLKPVIMAYSRPVDRARHNKLTDMLLTDEVRHIRYTAEFIESAATSGYRDAVITGMKEFQNLLNEATLSDLEETVNNFAEIYD